MKVTRRTALGALAGVTAIGAASAVGVGVYCARRDGSAAASLALAFADDPAAAIDVGRRFLVRHRADADLHRLEEAIGRTLVVQPGEIRCPVTAASALARQSAADFRSGRVVWVDGWLMGDTEARVCAHLALQANGAPAPG